jgi:D-psicose/D-tagatose/L-ribulose 3-epimerase
MKISASNIAWPEADDTAAFELLRDAGCASIEVAPTRVWPGWEGITPESLQEILFQKPELVLFGESASRAALAEHLCLCADIASALGAGPLVFGSPKNRNRGALSEQEAFDSAVAFFKPLARYFADRNALLCFEANPEQYGCNFITRGSEAAHLVRAVDEPGFGLHLDIACTEMAGEDVAVLIERNIDILRHYHASEPMLGSFDAPAGRHVEAAAMLAKLDYSHQVTLEMRTQEPALPALRTAIDFVATSYGGGHDA